MRTVKCQSMVAKVYNFSISNWEFDMSLASGIISLHFLTVHFMGQGSGNSGHETGSIGESTETPATMPTAAPVLTEDLNSVQQDIIQELLQDLIGPSSSPKNHDWSTDGIRIVFVNDGIQISGFNGDQSGQDEDEEKNIIDLLGSRGIQCDMDKESSSSQSYEDADGSLGAIQFTIPFDKLNTLTGGDLNHLFGTEKAKMAEGAIKIAVMKSDVEDTGNSAVTGTTGKIRDEIGNELLSIASHESETMPDQQDGADETSEDDASIIRAADHAHRKLRNMMERYLHLLLGDSEIGQSSRYTALAKKGEWDLSSATAVVNIEENRITVSGIRHNQYTAHSQVGIYEAMKKEGVKILDGEDIGASTFTCTFDLDTVKASIKRGKVEPLASTKESS